MSAGGGGEIDGGDAADVAVTMLLINPCCRLNLHSHDYHLLLPLSIDLRHFGQDFDDDVLNYDVELYDVDGLLRAVEHPLD